MKRWFAAFLAMFLAVSSVGQVSMAARMPCSAGAQPAASSAAATDDDAAQSPCHAPGAKHCSDACKRLCGNVAFVPQAVTEPATPVQPSRVHPPMSVSLLTRTSPPDTPPPIA